MKTCNRCSIEKPLDGFAKNGARLHPVCKVCRAAIERERRLQDPGRARELERARYAANPTGKKAAIRRHYEANRDKLIALEKDRYARLTDSILEQRKKYREDNPEKIRAHNGNRRAALRQAMPKWADRKLIADLYAEADRLGRATGRPYHVDHIIPLTHPLVCGLHVPANLQVIPGVENMRKRNLFVP